MSQFNTPGYDIQRPTGVCAFSGRKLEPGEHYIATLVEVEGDPEETLGPSGNKLGFKRLDVSQDIWRSGKRPDRIFSYWKSTVAHPNQKKKVFVDDDVLMQLFIRLADDSQKSRRAFRFVLALILMRKKLLRYESQTSKEVDVELPDGTTAKETEEWWDMSPKGEDKVYPVFNPHLDEAQITDVTKQLGEILEG